MADPVDAARWVTRDDIRAASEKAGHLGPANVADDIWRALRASTGTPSGLDVERLARALHLYMCAMPDSPHTLQPDRDMRRAELVAAEYARLTATPEVSDD